MLLNSVGFSMHFMSLSFIKYKRIINNINYVLTKYR